MMITKIKQETLALRKKRSPLGAVMQYHLAEISKIGKNKNRDTTEEEAIQYVKKTVQRMKEDQHADSAEIDVLESLLPQMASEDEVKEFLETLDGNMNKGQIMKAVREKYGALVDMKMVSGLV
jgi:uncharacterized protein YqeY